MMHKVEGIVIRTTDYGEANKILTLYSRELGKVGVVACGAKKPKSRFAAVSQLFTHAWFVFYQGSGMGTLTQGDVIDSFRGIRGDIEKTAWSAYVVELLDKLTEDKERNPFLFEQLLTALHLIEEGKDAEIVTRIFEIILLKAVGQAPEVRWCAACHRDQHRLLAFSVKEGGLICEGCLPRDKEAKVLSPGSIRLLRLFSQMDLRRLGNVEVKEETRHQLASVLRSFMDSYLDAQIKARNFLDQLDELNGRTGAIGDEQGKNAEH